MSIQLVSNMSQDSMLKQIHNNNNSANNLIETLAVNSKCFRWKTSMTLMKELKLKMIKQQRSYRLACTNQTWRLIMTVSLGSSATTL